MEAPLFRSGDKVMIAAVVEYVIDDRIKIVFDGLLSTAYVSAEALELVTPLFRPGERVVHANGEGGVVIAVHEDMAWVNMDAEGVTTLFASDLTLEPEASDPPSEGPAVAPETPPMRPGVSP